MRIGRFIIDTDSMTVEDITIIINELRNIRKRKEQMEHYISTIRTVIKDAQDEGFAITEKNFGQIIENDDLIIQDMGKTSK